MAKKILTKKLKQNIAELVATGMDVTEVCHKLGDVVKPQTVYREQVKDPEFAAMMDSAYSSFFMAKFSELNKLSNMPASEAYPNLEFKEGEATLKRRVDALKYALAKLAPQLSKRWDKPTKIEQTGNAGINVVIADYFAPNKVVESVKTLSIGIKDTDPS